MVVIEPGLIRTGFSEAAVGAMEPSAGDPTYQEFNEAVARATKDAYTQGPLAKLGGGPDDVAQVIEKALRARRPKARYTVTASAKLLLFQRSMLPDGAWDAFLRTQFPQPGAGLARTDPAQA